MDKHQENTKKVINFLKTQTRKKYLKYFILTKLSSKEYKLWKKYYSGASGLI